MHLLMRCELHTDRPAQQPAEQHLYTHTYSAVRERARTGGSLNPKPKRKRTAARPRAAVGAVTPHLLARRELRWLKVNAARFAERHLRAHTRSAGRERARTGGSLNPKPKRKRTAAQPRATACMCGSMNHRSPPVLSCARSHTCVGTAIGSLRDGLQKVTPAGAVPSRPLTLTAAQSIGAAGDAPHGSECIGAVVLALRAPCVPPEKPAASKLLVMAPDHQPRTSRDGGDHSTCSVGRRAKLENVK